MNSTRFVLFPALLVAGCTAPGPSREPPAPPLVSATEAAMARSEPAAPSATVPRTAPDASAARSLEEYKIEIARSILRANGEHTYEGNPPPMLKSVVVLHLSIDRDGQPSQVQLFRSNGFKALEQRAIQSVSRGAPYPKPAAQVLRGQRQIAFTETWLFRDDGKFQIRTLAGPQQSLP